MTKLLKIELYKVLYFIFFLIYTHSTQEYNVLCCKKSNFNCGSKSLKKAHKFIYNS